VLKWLQC